MYFPTAPAQRGFTLIELSIVLVIIGLLVGGVLVGQDLIRAAEVRALVSQIDKFNTAVNTFQGKYDALPGDMPNATSFWPTDSNCSSTGPATGPISNVGSESANATCNGDGNGQINYGDISSPYPTSAETYLVFQHLALAGMISGAYRGSLQYGPPFAHPMLAGTNQDADVCVFFDDGAIANLFTAPTPPWSLTGHHVYRIATSPCVSGGAGGGGFILSPARSYAVDRKIDDGLPLSGNVVTNAYYYDNCITPAGRYLTSNAVSIGAGLFTPNAIGCVLFVTAQF